MLVAGHATDRHPGQGGVGSEDGGGEDAEPSTARTYLGQGRQRDTEQRPELLRPPPVHDVEQQGAGGVAGVGGEQATIDPTGQVPQHPRIDGAQGQVGSGGTARREAPGAEQPPHLGGGEVGVEDEAGPLPDPWEVAVDRQLGTGFCGPTILPDDGAVGWLPGPAVPGDDGFALIGDADGPDHPVVVVESPSHLVEGGTDLEPDLARILFDPPGPGVIGGQLGIGLVDDPGRLVDDERTHAGGPGVHGDSHQRRGGHVRTVARRRHVPGLALLAYSNHLQTFANGLLPGSSCSSTVLKFRRIG